MKKYILFFLIFNTILLSFSNAQDVEKKVLLQGFWWGYENDNYPDGWANYLADLAPRLKEIGIDAVWIPPVYKNAFTSSTGYAPFDHYDLGDKFQKSWTSNTGLQVQTRVGTKDEVLRMIAIFHANGIEVIQDITLNHVSNAGTGSNGSGGLDTEATYSMASSGGFKNFRYICYDTPFTSGNECDYAQRTGRWPKNYMNFHPNPFHNVTTGDWEIAPWGPDLAYGYNEAGAGNGYGTSSNICDYSGCIDECYNPEQEDNYNRNQAREWIMWFKKQSNVDGFRWDAVKHFPYFVQQDFSYNCKYTLPEWAAGNEAMFNVGEYVGSKNELDSYVDDVASSNGGNEMMMGTFDFGLRAFDSNGGIYGMVTGGGAFDMASLPAAQQERRFTDINGNRIHRTVPMVNNHDTFRPNFDGAGNYISWNNGSELSPHIDPYNDRLALSYAVIMAVDGNPQIFFEDLFDIGANSNRFNHLPKNESQLPVRESLFNLIWCHQNLGFKYGDYKVRSTASGGNVFFNPGSSAADLLVIERSGRALIGMNDRGDEWQSAYVDSDFPAGTVLKDYSGANGNTTYTVPADGRVNVNTPPVDPANNQYGYSVWAPVDAANEPYMPPRDTRTHQEWEMANDLGDSHCKSLGQGGKLPDNACNYRIAGKIYAESGTSVNVTVYKTEANADLTVTAYNANGDILGRANNTTNPVELSFNAPATDWITIKVRNTNASQSAGVTWVKADYIAPTEIDAMNDFAVPTAAMWNGNGGNCNWNDCKNWDEGLVPTNNTLAIIPECIGIYPCIPDNFPSENLDDRSNGVNNIEVFSQEDFAIFPNPSNDIFQINCNTCMDNYQVSVYNILGKPLYTNINNIENINNSLYNSLKNTSQGTYFIHIKKDNQEQVFKWVKM